jgi:hypothetical protein
MIWTEKTHVERRVTHQQQLVASRLLDGAQHIALISDTPNLYRRTQDILGRDFYPDYDELLIIAKQRARVVSAFAMVNDGFPDRFVKQLEGRG